MKAGRETLLKGYENTVCRFYSSILKVTQSSYIRLIFRRFFLKGYWLTQPIALEEEVHISEVLYPDNALTGKGAFEMQQTKP